MMLAQVNLGPTIALVIAVVIVIFVLIFLATLAVPALLWAAARAFGRSST